MQTLRATLEDAASHAAQLDSQLAAQAAERDQLTALLAERNASVGELTAAVESSRY